jgi:hypothetical protein
MDLAAGQVKVIALIETTAGICAANEIAATGGRLLNVIEKRGS